MTIENICCNCHFYEGVKGVRGCAPCKANKKMKMWDDSCEKIWLIPERLKVIKPVSPDRCVDCANYVEGDPCHICEFTRKPKPITNADRIRSMTDEELAEEILELFVAFYEVEWSYEILLNWLKKEVKGESDD